eukprot:9140506-Pyramimonas_sp.AAC.1
MLGGRPNFVRAPPPMGVAMSSGPRTIEDLMASTKAEYMSLKEKRELYKNLIHEGMKLREAIAKSVQSPVRTEHKNKNKSFNKGCWAYIRGCTRP